MCVFAVLCVCVVYDLSCVCVVLCCVCVCCVVYDLSCVCFIFKSLVYVFTVPPHILKSFFIIFLERSKKAFAFCAVVCLSLHAADSKRPQELGFARVLWTHLALIIQTVTTGGEK